MKVNDFYQIVLENPEDPSAMEIGLDFNSQTFLPKYVQVDDLLLYDLPGFQDTRGAVANWVNACFIKRIIENARSVKLIFVVEMGQIDSTRVKASKRYWNMLKNSCLRINR